MSEPASTGRGLEKETRGARGRLIINADDWGRDRETTDRTIDCLVRGAISSVSAMVLMADSERAAKIALDQKVDAGLHLNFTTPFSAPRLPPRLVDHHERVSRHLLRHRLAPVVFHPGLIRSFEYLLAVQVDEYYRLYGTEPIRFDGHHHMHLCSNVVFGKLLPAGTMIRRNFSFEPGEKSFANRLYRRSVDRFLRYRHSLTDYFFSLTPFDSDERMRKLFALGREYAVELETHPVNPKEHRFLSGGAVFRWTRECRIADRFTLNGVTAATVDVS